MITLSLKMLTLILNLEMKNKHMTLTQQVPKLGATALIKRDNLSFEVLIVDIKTAWGKERYQVQPVAGYGLTWVENVKLISKSSSESMI